MNSIQLFKDSFYSQTTEEQWQSWKWQLQNRIHNREEVEKLLSLNFKEKEALKDIPKGLPFAVTPYYASLLKIPEIRKTLIPHIHEKVHSEGEVIDPLNEEELSPIRSIIHRYPDRVVFLVTQQCAVYCRYCTRGRLAGKSSEKFNKEDLEKGIQYISENSAIRDVIISGGDPLLLDDAALSDILKKIRAIPHVEIIRISSKIPVSMPMRFTNKLIDILKTNQPLILSVHINHPAEITKEFQEVAEKIADAGIMTGSQTVLLKGVNDSAGVMSDLMKKLLQCRIRPYSLYQLDPITGTSHFKTSIQQGLDIIQSMRGYISGYAIPHYIVDPPGGGGKIALTPDAILDRDENGYWLRNWQGKRVFYPDPAV
jgi:lysine 2,3-aminomutase